MKNSDTYNNLRIEFTDALTSNNHQRILGAHEHIEDVWLDLCRRSENEVLDHDEFVNIHNLYDETCKYV